MKAPGSFHWKQLFLFQQSQYRATFYLGLILILLSLARWQLPRYLPAPEIIPDTLLQKMLVQFQQQTDSLHALEQAGSRLHPFPFDPNTLDSAGWIRLGIKQALVRRILHYRNKGGKFYKPEGLQRIYGFPADAYQQLKDYIQIPGHEAAKLPILELNTCDSVQLEALPGIGSYMAAKIMQYRQRLGGYASIQQLLEIPGFRTETYQKLKGSFRVNTRLIRKLNLNQAGFYELQAHPYLRGQVAEAIADYRKEQDYQITKLEQLREIPLIDADLFRKIVPYLSL